MVRIEKNSHMLAITHYAGFFRFFSVFGTFSLKVLQTWYVWHETWHTTLFGIYYCVEMVRVEKNTHMLEITS